MKSVLLTTGRALGREDQAWHLIDRVGAKITEAEAANPAFADKVLVADYGPENGGHYLIGKGDPSRTLFDALGFEAQDTVGEVSEEQLSGALSYGGPDALLHALDVLVPQLATAMGGGPVAD